MGPLNDEQEKALATVGRRSNKLCSMINTIMDATRLEAGLLKAEICPVDIVELLDEVKDSYGIGMSEGTPIAWNIPEALPFMKTNPNKLRQVLINLLNNAIKFGRGGAVTISAKARVAEDGEPSSIESKIPTPA